MIPLQVTPPIIPDKPTFEMIIGPYGAVFLLATFLSLAVWMCWRLIGKNDALQASVNALHKDYAAQLLTLQKEAAAKYEAMAEKQIRADIEGIAAARELAATVKASVKQ